MTMQGWGVRTIAGLGMFAGWFLACAGDDIPPIEDELRGALAQNFGGASMEVGSAGTAGSGTGGRGGSGSGNGGSANNAGSGNAAGGAAGDGGGPVGGGGSGDTCDAFNTILLDRCGSSGCHNDGSPQGAFAVSEQDVLEFVDRPSTKGNACDQLFIDSSNPEESLLYTRLFSADCGGILSMPLSGDPLTEEQSDCVLSWLGQFAE
jgi:hypothetical protein